MSSENKFTAQWDRFCKMAGPKLKKAKEVMGVGLEKTGVACKFIAKFKKVFLVLPILTVALIMAFVNLFKLPDMVGFILQGDGTFAFEIIRAVAVFVPLLITLLCLVLVFISKRTMTPWMVSLCSLLLPLLLYFTNVFPS